MKLRLFAVALMPGIAPPLVGQEPARVGGGALFTVGVERYASGDAALTAIVLRARRPVEDGGMGVELGVAVSPDLLDYGVLPLGMDLNLFPTVQPDRSYMRVRLYSEPVPVWSAGLGITFF